MGKSTQEEHFMEKRFPKSEADKPTDTESLELTPFGWRLFVRSPAWKPPTDVYETENAMVVRVEVAGMREDNFSIELNGRELIIRGVRQDTDERRAFHQMEIRFSEFVLSLELPFYISTEQVQAVYNNGFLRVMLPKAQPRQIPIVE
jgi:HSP20 family protein